MSIPTISSSSYRVLLRVDRFVTTVNNTIRVWMSNANALKLQVIGDGRTESIEVGRPGQVLVQDIKWIKDYDGKYKLVVLEVD